VDADVDVDMEDHVDMDVDVDKIKINLQMETSNPKTLKETLQTPPLRQKWTTASPSKRKIYLQTLP
jgi:hypothetical protein